MSRRQSIAYLTQMLAMMIGISICASRVESSSISTFSNSSSATQPYQKTGAESSRCPHNCSCSKDLVNCSHAEFEDIPVISDPRLKRLILDNNKIAALHVNSFAALNRSSINTLTLRNNSLSVIDSAAFETVPELHSLFLDENRLSQLPATVFDATKNLQVLSVAKNPIGASEIDWLFLRPLLSLKILDVSETFIGNVRPLPVSFSSLTELEELRMQNEYINITSGYFAALADVKLRSLDLSVCVINSVDEEAFLPLVNLKYLHLANAMINAKTCENIFQGLANGSLEKIDMRGVFIYTDHPVDAHLFHNLSNTKVLELNFAGNYVGLRGRIPPRLFHPLKALRKLHLDDCDLVSIRHDAFHGLHDLKVLTLRRNLLSCVHSSDCGFLNPGHPMRHLETLDLTDNLLSKTGEFISFQNESFPVLTTLNLRRNRLRSVPVGMFDGLRKLTHLDLSENLIRDIEVEAFASLESLTSLNLDGCRQLNRIRQGTFKGLDRLQTLSIHGAGLVHIHHAALTHLVHLSDLNLRNNKLGQDNEAIEKVCIQKSNLKGLDLGENNLRYYPRCLLSNSIHLKKLHLDENRLTDCLPLVPVKDVLTQLEILDLSYNSLVNPGKACFESFKQLESVDLSVNPYYCTCDTQELSSWLLQRGMIPEPMEADYVCAGPESLAGTNVFHLNLGNFDCHWKYGVVTGLLVCLLLISVVVILVLCFRQMGRGSGTSCNGSAPVGSSSAAEAGGTTGCARFKKSAPYAPLDEEEMTMSGDIVDATPAAASNGVCRSSTGSQSADDAALLASSKKSSKCNGFIRAKTRHAPLTSSSSSCRKEDTTMQTRALVEDTSTFPGAEDDLCHVPSPYFLQSTNNGGDNIESLEDTV